MVPGHEIEGNSLGLDCSGIVRRVGSDVHHVKPHDRVMAWTFKAQSTRVKTWGRRCVKIPDGLSYEDAATMPSVYVTAFESLQRVGRLEAGQVSTELRKIN